MEKLEQTLAELLAEQKKTNAYLEAQEKAAKEEENVVEFVADVKTLQAGSLSELEKPIKAELKANEKRDTQYEPQGQPFVVPQTDGTVQFAILLYAYDEDTL